jgi:hypothetical protein
MAVIVKHRQSGERCILLGAGFGAYKATRPGAFFGNWSPVAGSGQLPVVLVCDAAGLSRWIKSDLLQVESVEGRSAGEVLEAEHASEHGAQP